MRGPKGDTGAAGGTVLFWSGILDAATAYFVQLFRDTSAPSNTRTVINEIELTSARTLSRLRVSTEANVTKNVTFTIYQNGSATALTCTIASGTASASDLTHSVAFAQGDTVALQATNTAGSPGGTFVAATLESV